MEEVWRRRAVALIAVMAFVACSGFLYQIVASGDVTGDLPGPLTVAKLQGRTLDSAAPSTGNTITWDGSKWLPAMFSWSNLTGTVPNISTFTNDSGYITSSGSVANWTGNDQINILLDEPAGLANRNIAAAHLNTAKAMTMSKVNCTTDSGIVELRLYTPSGDIVTSLNCTGSGGNTTSLGVTALAVDHRLGYQTTILSGTPTSLAIAIIVHR